MEHKIQAFDIFSAYARLREEFEEQGKTLPYNGFIDISRQITDQRKDPQTFKDLGFLWGYCEEEPGDNQNKIQFSIENRIHKGDKIWLTKYAIAADYPHAEKIITIGDITYYDYKNDCEKAAKEWTSKHKRSSHVIITKIPKDFTKAQTSVWYKASPNQKPGLYVFFS